MQYETSYDSGAKPFNHDKNRGKWESSKDFLFACVGHAFKPDTIMLIPLLVFETFGIYAVVPYLVTLAVCVVPIVFIQSFLGQFSSTGFISVFRIAPLFKGIGYVSLVVNFVNLTYYSVFSAIPLLYAFHSLRPTIPWSCEGSSHWMATNNSICNSIFGTKIPSVEFFRNQFHSTSGRIWGTYFSVQIMICTVIVWSIVTFVLLKPTELIGRYMRYSFLIVVTIMSLCLLRFIFLPGAINGLWEFLNPVPSKLLPHLDMLLFIFVLVFSTLGPGWGSILTMASYNKFETNIFRYSWVVCLAQLAVITGMTFLSIFLKHFMKIIPSISISQAVFRQDDRTEFLKLPTSLTYLKLSNFWSVLFFSMIILGSLNLLVVQLFSLLTSLFDEFEVLREIKRTIVFGTVAVLTLTSMLFCSNKGLFFAEVLVKLSGITQVILNFLLLLVVLWVYGRERFQRDLNFMTSRIYSTWMVYVVRFVSPIILLLVLAVSCVKLLLYLLFNRDTPSDGLILFFCAFIFFLVQWCLIPSYCVVKIKQTAGKIGIRLKRCIRPTDWYPADPVYKQSYEERFSSTDISHPLSVLTEE